MINWKSITLVLLSPLIMLKLLLFMHKNPRTEDFNAKKVLEEVSECFGTPRSRFVYIDRTETVDLAISSLALLIKTTNHPAGELLLKLNTILSRDQTSRDLKRHGHL